MNKLVPGALFSSRVKSLKEARLRRKQIEAKRSQKPKISKAEQEENLRQEYYGGW